MSAEGVGKRRNHTEERRVRCRAIQERTAARHVMVARLYARMNKVGECARYARTGAQRQRRNDERITDTRRQSFEMLCGAALTDGAERYIDSHHERSALWQTIRNAARDRVYVPAGGKSSARHIRRGSSQRRARHVCRCLRRHRQQKSVSAR